MNWIYGWIMYFTARMTYRVEHIQKEQQRSHSEEQTQKSWQLCRETASQNRGHLRNSWRHTCTQRISAGFTYSVSFPVRLYKLTGRWVHEHLDTHRTCTSIWKTLNTASLNLWAKANNKGRILIRYQIKTAGLWLFPLCTLLPLRSIDPSLSPSPHLHFLFSLKLAVMDSTYSRRCRRHVSVQI